MVMENRILIVHSGDGPTVEFKEELNGKLGGESQIITIESDVFPQAILSFPTMDLVILLEGVDLNMVQDVYGTGRKGKDKPYTISLSKQSTNEENKKGVHEHVESITTWNTAKFYKRKKN